MRASSILIFAAPLVAIALAYQLGPHSTLDVGSFLDGPFVAGFHGREATAEYSYRWSQGDAQITLVGLPALAPVEVSARLSSYRPDGIPATVSITLGHETVTRTVTQDTREVDLGGATTDGLGSLTVRIVAETFSTPTDPRKMGLKVDWVKARPLSPPYLPSPVPLASTMLLAIAWALVGTSWSRWAYLILSAATVASLLLGSAVVALAVSLVGGAGGAAAAMAVHRDRVRDWLSSLDAEPTASRLLVIGLAIWIGFSLWVILHTDFIGHADYADNAVVARNFVLGKGMVTNYVAQFYRHYPELSHPSDTWPPLQPLLIAVAFTVLGISTWAAKVPNLIAMAILAVVVYRWTRELVSPAAGLFGATAVLTHDYLFSGVVYPLNDVALTLILFLFLLGCTAHLETGVLRPGMAVRLGVLLGLATLAKPSGALFAFSLVIPLADQLKRGQLNWRMWGLLAASAAVVYLPWAVRNMLLFGIPFYSTETHDAFVLRYRPPWENIYRIYWDNPPGVRDFLRAGWDLWMQTTWDEMRNLWTTFALGRLMPPALLLMALGGVVSLRGRAVKLLWVTLPGLTAYTAFIVSYWHVETRYFLPLVPLLTLWAAYFLRGLSGLATRPVRVLMAPAAILLVLCFQGGEVVSDSLRYYTSPTAIVEAAKWAKTNLPPDAVVMTRNPWEFSFHSERMSVMIPAGTAADAALVAKTYGARYLQLDHLSDPVRPYLGPLYKGSTPKGFTLVYRNPDVLIYALDATGIATLQRGKLE